MRVLGKAALLILLSFVHIALCAEDYYNVSFSDDAPEDDAQGEE